VPQELEEGEEDEGDEGELGSEVRARGLLWVAVVPTSGEMKLLEETQRKGDSRNVRRQRLSAQRPPGGWLIAELGVNADYLFSAGCHGPCPPAAPAAPACHLHAATNPFQKTLCMWPCALSRSLIPCVRRSSST
jgi:hypothetical protein